MMVTCHTELTVTKEIDVLWTLVALVKCTREAATDEIGLAYVVLKIAPIRTFLNKKFHFRQVLAVASTRHLSEQVTLASTAKMRLFNTQ